ncbi:reprolysin-like metallopeptidase [Portibacter marinus]|uniref:reprolysin-like metallopeptidase n=1 Tax=Portibacter marinus TaxID=2898660 RepID=UPI001F1EE917|nr:zinc-dependent metalloprotease family protein [Portibacter marinus]
MKYIYLFLALLVGFNLSSQNWLLDQPVNIRSTGERKIVPDQFLLARVNNDELRLILEGAPNELQNYRNPGVKLRVMISNGTIDEFEVYEYSMLEPALAAKFPEFKTFVGKSSTDDFRTIRIDQTTNGFRAVIADLNGRTYIDPYQQGDVNTRIIYKRAGLRQSDSWICETDAPKIELPTTLEQRFAGDCSLRTYRLAVAATGEYTAFHGGTVAAAQAEIVTAINRVNQIYEQDLTVRLILIGNNSSVIYTNSNSDPYTNSDGFAMLDENQSNLDAEIGSDNYDIGHVFSTGGGGVAALGSICNQFTKGQGVTGLGSPTGDPFYIDFVCHEIGHQFGGPHTFNSTTGSCGGGNKSNANSFEPGSGTTIMAYAGICGNENVQNNSDPYFHSKSIELMVSEILSNNCHSTITFINNAPQVSVLIDKTVPRSTYLLLDAQATDPDGDPITYCWEQIDIGGTNDDLPAPSNTVGPLFRSLPPVANSSRFLPSIDNIINNSSDPWEVLPDVSRTMNFRVTVRDHALQPGCTEERDIEITVDGNSGPFVVNSNSIPATVKEGQNLTINWEVAGTDLAPVSCSNVDIFLSTDGGLTYPTSIVSGTDNDGTESIIIPAGLSTSARIMIKCSDNIFFDINDSNFTIEEGNNGFTLELDPISLVTCADQSATFNINSFETGTFTTPINLSVTGVPSGANVAYSANPIVAGNSSTVTISNLGANQGTFTLDVVGAAGSVVRTKNFDLELVQPTIFPGLISPSDGANNVSLTPTLSWTIGSNALGYEYEISTQPNGNNVIATGTSTSNMIDLSTALSELTTYYWRVRSFNDCGQSSYSSEYSFTTKEINEVCQSFMATGLPINIIDATTTEPSQTNSFLTISGLSGNILDVDVINLNGTHTYVGDLLMAIFSPNGNATQVNLFNNICESDNDFDLGFDDEAASDNIPCPPTDGISYRPITALSTWDGQDPNGSWQLAILDQANQDSGTLNSWSLRICIDQEVVCNLNVTVTTATGPGSLLSALECAQNGDIITLDASLSGQNIDLGANKMIIEKDITIESNPSNDIGITYSGTGPALEIKAGGKMTMKGAKINQN